MMNQFINEIRSPMSIQQLKEALHLRIEQIDPRFLKVMYVMTETYLKEQEDLEIEKQITEVVAGSDWKPMSEEELTASYIEASTEYKKGNYKTIDEVKKDWDKW